MRKLGVVEFVTLDGVMQGLGGPDEDREAGSSMAVGAPPWRRAAGAAGRERHRPDVGLPLRAQTYEHMAAHWPHEPADNPIAASLNATPKYVATRTLHQQDLEWANCRVPRPRRRRGGPGAQGEGRGVVTGLGSGLFVQTLSRTTSSTSTGSCCIRSAGTGKPPFREHPTR